MRVLMLAQWYAPVIGGEERHVESLAHALTARGHDVSVATLAHRGQPDFSRDDHVGVYRIRSAVQNAGWLFANPERQSAPPAPDPAVMLKLRKLMGRLRPDVIHAHNWLIHSYLPLHGPGSPPLVLTLHDYSLVCAKKNLMYRGALCDGPALAKCLRCASRHYGIPKAIVTVGGVLGRLPRERVAVDRFIAVSQAVADGNQLGSEGLRYDVIPNFISNVDPVDDPALDHLIAELPTEPFILYVGGLAAIKGVEVLLRAYRRMVDPPPLVLIGYTTGDPVAALGDLPSGARVLSDWPHAAVLSAWKRSLFGVVPSVWAEPFGIVAIEAMAAGRPLVASSTGGLQDIVDDGRTGFLVAPGDERQLSAAMSRLVEDAALRERMGAAGLKRVARFREAAVVPQIERLYDQVVAARTRRDTAPSQRNR
jgi:glycosyltransferase involved in cell wall biosynthesis